jgi:hypothetical protein
MKHGITQVETVVRSLGRNIVSEYPSVRSPILRGWNAYRHAYAHLVCFKDALTYAQHTDLSPFEVIALDPEQIEYLVEQNGYPRQTYDSVEFPDSKFRYAGTVRGGDWDRCEMRFEETDLYQGFKAHFNHGVAWSDTTFFRRVLDFIDDGIVLWGCTNRVEFERRCDRIDDLYESIRTNGYRSRHQLAQSDTIGDETTKTSASIPDSVCDEIAVCIGRDGDILFFDGRNRLAIAKLLDLDAVPVWIMVRHEQWQARREAYAVDNADHRERSHLREHPDLPTTLLG